MEGVLLIVRGKQSLVLEGPKKSKNKNKLKSSHFKVFLAIKKEKMDVRGTLSLVKSPVLSTPLVFPKRQKSTTSNLDN